MSRKKVKMVAGIYKIINKVNNKYYLGSSKNINKRYCIHLSNLKKNKHHCSYLQNAYNKYGKDSFYLEILLVVNFSDNLEAELKTIEQFFLDNLEYSQVYNISSSASGGDLIKNHPQKQEIINKRNKKFSDYLSSLTKEQIIARSSRPGSLNYNWRGGHKFFCVCGKPIAKINKTCCSCRDRFGAKNPFYGKSQSEKTKEKIALTKKNLPKILPANTKAVDINGIYYESLTEASKFLKISIASVIFRIKSKNKKFAGYKYAN